MKQKRLDVGVVFGGTSAEHEVSWQSARNVVKAMDPDTYRPVPILIDKQGGWLFLEPDELYSDDFLKAQGSRRFPAGREIVLAPEAGKLAVLQRGEGRKTHTLDVIFPLVHGPYGEDGTLQGLCKLYQTPFVGPGVMASALCMDKDVMKRLLEAGGIPGSRFLVFKKKGPAVQGSREFSDAAIDLLGLPLFVKPANLGSSVGITKVSDKDDLPKALDYALQFDEKAVVEEFIEGREIECSVLGNEDPIASIPGEIVPRHDFYSYQAKYLDPDGAVLNIPADLSPELTARVQDLALKSFVAMGCEGMARVDFFVRKDGSVLVNELNTIPGFTDISMYPKLWEAGGISCRELVHKLIQLGLERFQREAGKVATGSNRLIPN